MPKKIGVIGFGSIGRRHVNNLLELGHTIFIYDPDDSVGRTVDSVEELVSKSDAVVIASPTEKHIEHVDACVFQNRRDIFVEKPIFGAGTSLVAAERLVRQSHVNATALMVGYNQRFNSAVKQAKEWLDAGEIGEISHASFVCSQFNAKPIYRRDGVILNWSHEIDLAIYLLGDVNTQSIQSLTKFEEGQDVMVDINMVHKGGCHTHVHLDYLTAPERRGFTIVGAKGHIQAILPERIATLRYANGHVAHFVDDVHGYDQDYKDEMAAFVDQIDGKDTIGCTGTEALKVLEICLEVRKQAGLA